MKRKQIYNKALQKWGFNAQSIMLTEECAELIQAVSKLHRTGNPMLCMKK
jgi:NTP pyrophosphatase (non-canonical NTP hydrolase)